MVSFRIKTENITCGFSKSFSVFKTVSYDQQIIDIHFIWGGFSYVLQQKGVILNVWWQCGKNVLKKSL